MNMNSKIKKIKMVRGGNAVVFCRIAKQRYGLDVIRGRYVYYVVNGKGYNYHREATKAAS